MTQKKSMKEWWSERTKTQKYVMIGGYIIFFLYLINMNGNSFPDEWRGKRLYSASDSRKWIVIRSDNTFTLHEYIPNSEETFEWNGTVEDMTLKSSKSFVFQGRNDFRPSSIDPHIEVLDIGGKFLRINFEGFSTITGSDFTDGRNYMP
jgi:hypothetical protein